MSLYILLAWVVSWSCVVTLGSQARTTTNPLECNVPLISECQCGESGRYQDVYVSSCQVHSADNATRCEPCPGSCGAYKLCKTCSKESCLSCPTGRWGRFCENAKNSEAKNLDYSEVSESEVKSHIQETGSKEDKFELLPALSERNLPIKNISPEKLSKSWKYKGKPGKNKYYRDPITVKDAETTQVTVRDTEQPYTDIEKAPYVDVFQSKDNPKVSHLFSNKTEKFTSIQKSKKKLTVVQESLRENDRVEFLPLAKKQENESDIGHGRLINRNGSFIYTKDSVNSPVSDTLKFSTGNVNFSEIIDLKKDNFKERSKENSDEKFNSSPSHSNNSSMFRLKFQSSDRLNIEALQEKKEFNSSSSHWEFPYESPEVHESSDSKKDENFNSSSNHWKFPNESPKVHEISDSGKVKNFNSSSIYSKFSHESPQMYENDNLEAKGNLNGSSSQWSFPRGFPEVQESANSEENIKLNSSYNYWKLPFESSEVQESPRAGKQETNGQILEPKNQEESGQFFEKEFDFKDIKDPSFSLSYRKDNFHASESEKESAKSGTEDKNSKLNAMGYRLAIAFNQSGHNEANFSQIYSNKQSNSPEMVSESPEMQIPSSSSNKMKIIDTEGNVRNVDTEFTNVSREQVDMDKIGNSSETSDVQISKLSEDNSKEYTIVNPLEVNIFKITFIGENSDSPYNRHNRTIHTYNITEKRLSENGGKLNITQTSQNETSELSENTATRFHGAIPHNASIFRHKIFKENTNLSSGEKNKKIAIYPSEHHREGNTKGKKAYYKRNAATRPHDDPQYDLDMVQKMIMQLPDLTMNKAKKPSDEKLYISQSFSTSNIPENHILMPLYFPEMYNAEYQSNFLHNNQPHKLCDLYPNFSPCFRVRMILPGSPFTDLFGSKSQIQSKLHGHKGHSHSFPQVNYHDSESKMDMHSSTQNGHSHLTDSQLLALLMKYLQSKNTENTSPLSLQNFQPSLLSKGPQSQIQGWNKDEWPKDGIVSLLLAGLINPFLSFMFPKYGGAKPPTQSAVLRQKEFHKSQPGQSVASNEIIEFSLDVNEPLQSRSLPNTYGYRFSRPDSILKVDESHEKNCSEESSGSIQKDNSKAEMVPKTLDSIQIKIIRPMFGQMSFENDIDKRGELNFLESEEDPFFEPCVKCVFTESVYEDVGAEKKLEKALPTIFRALVVEEEGLEVENKSDSEKQNASRSRRSMYSYGTQSWCPIVRQMLNGDLDCTIWSYQKVCLLICHPGFKCKNSTFTCSRQNNTWEPNITPCEPIISYRGLGYRNKNDSYFDDVLNYLPDRKENFEDVGSYYNRLVNSSYNIFGDMGANNQEESFPYYDSPPLHFENDNGNQNIRNMPFEISGNSEFDLNHRLSNNASLDFRVNPEFPVESYPSIVAQDGRDNGNYGFGNIQGFPGDSTADRTNNSNFGNIQGFPGYKVIDGTSNSNFGNIQGFPGYKVMDGTRNSTFDNIQGFPGYKVIDGTSNSTFDNIQRFPGDMTADRTENSKYDNNQGHPGYEMLNRNSNSTFDNTQGFPGGRTDGRIYNNQGYPVYEILDRKNNSTFDNSQGFPDGRTDGRIYNNQGYPGYEMLDRKNNSTYGNAQGFPVDGTDSRKENFSTYNRQGFPAYEVLGRKDNSTYAVAQSLPSGMTGDRKDNVTFYDAQRVPVENENSKDINNKTRDLPDFAFVGGKNIDKTIASLDDMRNSERIFDMYEKKRALPKNSSYNKFEAVEKMPPVEESDEQSDPIYSFFERENPEPGNDDPESRK